jgi:uncharacterized protein YbjT (DUF2867 family)
LHLGQQYLSRPHITFDKGNIEMSNITTIVVAGATGNLGGRIVKSVLKQGAAVRALVRTGTVEDKSDSLRRSGASVAEVNFHKLEQVAKACAGASCVVSTLAGLRDVIVDAQQTLLEGSIRAGVPRFIPSDFSADYTRWPQYENRTLDLRREFKTILDKAPISSTSILNAAFLDLLLSTYPAFRFAARTVTYWEDPDIKLEFTKLDDIAAFTALAALDAAAPRLLRIVGERVSARELAALAQEISGQRFELINGGSIAELSERIALRQAAAAPEDIQLYPDWQRLMYVRSYFSRSAEVGPLDNYRYPDFHWTTARELLQQHVGATSTPALAAL